MGWVELAGGMFSQIERSHDDGWLRYWLVEESFQCFVKLM